MKGFLFAILAVALLPIGEAQDKPKAMPEVTQEHQNQYKSLVIKDKNLQLDEQQLQLRYIADEQAKTANQAELEKFKAKVLIDLKLDPAKYSVVAAGDDSVKIVEKK